MAATKIELWNELPHSVQLNLSKKYGIKWFGTTEAQLEFDLENKLPKDLLVEIAVDEAKTPEIAKFEFVESPDEEVEETIEEKLEEIKPKKTKSNKKSK